MARDFDFLSEQAYEDTPLPADLGLESVVPTATTPIGQALPAGGAANAPVGIATALPASQAAPDYSGLSKQISDYWKALKIDPTMKGINRADELARLLQAQGITEFDPTKFGLKETKIMDPEYTQEGEAGSVTIPAAERILKQLTYGDKTFGVLGGYGSKGEFDPRTEEFIRANNALATSYAGEGQVQYVPVQDKQGNVIIVPKWASSSDIDPMMMQIIGMGLNFALPGLGLGLGAAGNAALAGGITGLIGSGGNVEAALKGAALGGVGGLTSQYLNPAVAELVKDAGLTGLPADIAAKALTTAGTSAARAAITGDSILDAATRGLGAGAAGAAASGAVDELGLPADVAKIANPVLTAALLGQDPTQALVSSLISQATKQGAPGKSVTDKQVTATPDPQGTFTVTNEDGTYTKIFPDGTFKNYDEEGLLVAPGIPSTGTIFDPNKVDVAASAEPATAKTTADIQATTEPEYKFETAGNRMAAYDDLFDLAGITQPESKTADLSFETVADRMRPYDELFVPTDTTVVPKSKDPDLQFVTTQTKEQQPFDLIEMLDRDLAASDLPAEEPDLRFTTTAGKELKPFDELDAILTKPTEPSPPPVLTEDGAQRVEVIGKREPLPFDEINAILAKPEDIVQDAGKVEVIGKAEPKTEAPAPAPAARAPAPAPKSTTRSTSPVSKTAAQSGLDVSALLALLAMMGGEQQAAAPQQEIFDITKAKGIKDIFGQYFA